MSEGVEPTAAPAAPPPHWLTFPRLLLLVLIGPLLALAWRTGTKIAADREAWRLGRELSALTADGRPDARVLLHLTHGSNALFSVLAQKVRTGPFEERAGIARALGCSLHLAVLPELVAELRDGCLDPEGVVIGGRPEFPLRVLPPDELAFAQPDHARAFVERFALEAKAPFDVAWARTYLFALRAPSSLDGDLVTLAASDDPIVRERAARLLTWALTVKPEEAPPVAPSAKPALLALVGPRPTGRLAAALLTRYFLGDANEEVRSLSEQLTPADLLLARDPVALAHAARALARGDSGAAQTLGLLATRDPQALEPLIAAVGSGAESGDPTVRAAAVAALEGSSDARAIEALKAARK